MPRDTFILPIEYRKKRMTHQTRKFPSRSTELTNRVSKCLRPIRQNKKWSSSLPEPRTCLPVASSRRCTRSAGRPRILKEASCSDEEKGKQKPTGGFSRRWDGAAYRTNGTCAFFDFMFAYILWSTIVCTIMNIPPIAQYNGNAAGIA